MKNQDALKLTLMDLLRREEVMGNWDLLWGQ
jgi:hypothetical protein